MTKALLNLGKRSYFFCYKILKSKVMQIREVKGGGVRITNWEEDFLEVLWSFLGMVLCEVWKKSEVAGPKWKVEYSDHNLSSRLRTHVQNLQTNDDFFRLLPPLKKLP